MVVQLIGLAGFAALFYGLHGIHASASWAVAGLLLMAWAVRKSTDGGGAE